MDLAGRESNSSLGFSIFALGPIRVLLNESFIKYTEYAGISYNICRNYSMFLAV
jgi:hypothetical protein